MAKMRTSGRRERTAIEVTTRRKERMGAESSLLLYSQNRVLCRLRDSEFDDGLRWNLDLLLRFWIKTRACLPLLLDELAESRHDEFAVLFGVFVRDGAKRIEKYSSGPFIGLCGFGNCGLKFCLGHLISLYGSVMTRCQDNRSYQLERGFVRITKSANVFGWFSIGSDIERVVRVALFGFLETKHTKSGDHL